MPEKQKAWYIVTGANAGIGKALAEGLSSRGFPVVMPCRNRAKAMPAMDEKMSKVPGAQMKFISGDLSDNRGVRFTGIDQRL